MENQEPESEDRDNSYGALVVAVLTEDAHPDPHSRRRKVQRREPMPFTEEERLAIEQEIIKANAEMRSVESEKATQNKTWNAQINAARETMDEAIDVLKTGCFYMDVERIEEFNYEMERVYYYDCQTGHEVEHRDMTEEEKQTRMNL
jgi:hypothetical protein